MKSLILRIALLIFGLTQSASLMAGSQDIVSSCQQLTELAVNYKDLAMKGGDERMPRVGLPGFERRMYDQNIQKDIFNYLLSKNAIAEWKGSGASDLLLTIQQVLKVADIAWEQRNSSTIEFMKNFNGECIESLNEPLEIKDEGTTIKKLRS